MDTRTLEELRELGAGSPAPENVVRLYRQAFENFGPEALWSRVPVEQPTVRQALTVAENLRHEGNMNARKLAQRIEDACRAAL